MRPNLTPSSGTMDLIGEELEMRQNAITSIEHVFRSFGLTGMQTPALERLETLTGKYGDEGEKLIFKILRRGEGAKAGEADLALRYDLTIAGLRAYANNRAKLPQVFKRYQIGPVWRADRPGKGRLREFSQCDIDIYGAAEGPADQEVLEILTTALRSLGLDSFEVRINSRRVIAALLRSYEVPDGVGPAVVGILDKVDKIGAAGICSELEQLAVETDTQSQLSSLIRDIQKERFNDEAINRLQAGTAKDKESVDEIATFVQRCEADLKTATFKFDPLLARGLDYYTGFIFEIYSAGTKGAIAAGGRYDNLAEAICGFPMPIVGGSLGLERVLLSLTGMRPTPRRLPLFFSIFSEDLRAASARVAQNLRSAGVATYLDVSKKRLDKQLSFADKYGFGLCAILGPEEAAKGELLLKDMKSGSQERFKLSDIAELVRKLQAYGR